MYVIMLLHDDGDVTFVSEWTGAVRIFKTYSRGQAFIEQLPKEYQAFVVRLPVERR